MKEISATDAARSFSDVLDAVEHQGETFAIHRRGKVIARIEPAAGASVADVVRILRKHPPDDCFKRDIEEAMRFLIPQEREWGD